MRNQATIRHTVMCIVNPPKSPMELNFLGSTYFSKSTDYSEVLMACRFQKYLVGEAELAHSSTATSVPFGFT